MQQLQNEGKESNLEGSTDSLLQQQCRRMDGIGEKDVAIGLSEPSRLSDFWEPSSGDGGTPRKAQEISTEIEVFEMELEKREACAHKSRGFANDNVHLCSNGPPVSFDHGTGDALIAPSSSRSLVASEEAEFFDAPDSVFSDTASEDEVYSTSVKPGRCLEGWNSRAATRLEEEMARWIRAEGNVVEWQRQWNAMAKRCASMGVSLPTIEVDNGLGNESDPAEAENQELFQHNQKVIVARMVAGAIARAIVRTEKDEELEYLVGVKNREISRLWDKLQYLELINREMSQRNQEVTEATQRRKKRRQRRRKLALGGFCAAFCIGTAGLLCYRYVPWDQTKSWAEILFKPQASENDTK